MIHNRSPSLRATGTRAFPQSFLNQLAAVKTLQVRIAAYRMGTSFTPEKPQQRTALFRYSTEPLICQRTVTAAESVSSSKVTATG